MGQIIIAVLALLLTATIAGLLVYACILLEAQKLVLNELADKVKALEKNCANIWAYYKSFKDALEKERKE